MTSKGKDGVAQNKLWTRPDQTHLLESECHPVKSSIIPSGVCVGCNLWDSVTPTKHLWPTMAPGSYPQLLTDYGLLWGMWSAHFRFQERRWGRPSKLPSRMKRPRERPFSVSFGSGLIHWTIKELDWSIGYSTSKTLSWYFIMVYHPLEPPCCVSSSSRPAWGGLLLATAGVF